MGDLYFYFETMAERLSNTLTFLPKTDLIPYVNLIKPFPDAYSSLKTECRIAKSTFQRF